MRRIFDFALRVFSYAFTAITGLVLLGLGVVSKSSGDTLVFQNLPWKGSELTTWLLVLGVFGILAAAGAALTKGAAKFLLPLWNAIFTFLMVRGNFLSAAKSFESVTEFQLTIAFTIGAIGSLLASLMQLKKRA